MPRLVEMGVIEARCQRRADLENDSHIAHATWLELVSEAYGELFGIVADAGMRYFEREEDLTTDGTNVLEEPSDHLSTIGLWYVPASGQRQIVKPIQAHELARWSASTGSVAKRYELIDDEIRLYPTPPTGQTYAMRYIPQAPDLTGFASDDCLDVVCAEGEAFLIWNVVVKALSMSESDVRLALAERERMRERLTDWAVHRAMVDPQKRYVAEEDEYADLREGDWRLVR